MNTHHYTPWWHARALKPIWWAILNSTPDLRGAYLYYYYYYYYYVVDCSTRFDSSLIKSCTTINHVWYYLNQVMYYSQPLMHTTFTKVYPLQRKQSINQAHVACCQLD